MYINQRRQHDSINTILLLVTIFTSITRHCLCGVITDTTRHHRGSNNQEENEEVARQREKMLKKLLDGMGMESVPKNTMPRADIPDVLLRDMMSADDEDHDQALDTEYEKTNEKFQKKKITVFGNIGKWFYLFNSFIFYTVVFN